MAESADALDLGSSAGDSQPCTQQALTKPGNPARTEYVTKCAAETPVDPSLAAVVAAWTELPEPVRAGMVAMVKAAKR